MTAALIIGSIFFALAIFEIWRDMNKKQERYEIEPRERKIYEPTPRTLLAEEPLPEIYEGDILEELSRTSLHIMFGVMSGAGKSTSMKMIIWKIHQHNPTARFIIIDPKTTDWLGLQLYLNTVFYLSGEIIGQMLQLKAGIAIVYRILDARITAGQKLLRVGELPPEPANDLYLIIDEWFAVVDALKKIPAALKAQHELNDIQLYVNALIAKGREHKIHVFLASQSHLSGETGISTAMRRSVALVGQGRITKSGDGGYASIEGIIKDSNVFKDSAKREYLMQCLRKAIAEGGDSPIIMTTMGTPRIGLLDDLSHVHTLRITDYVQTAIDYAILPPPLVTDSVT